MFFMISFFFFYFLILSDGFSDGSWSTTDEVNGSIDGNCVILEPFVAPN